MKSTCLSALLVAANARSFGPDYGYGDLGVYGYGIYGYGEFLGVYGQDGYDYDDLKPTPSGDKGADTCLNGECDMGDDVDDMGDDMGDFDDGDSDMPVPVPAGGTPPTASVPPAPTPATGGSSGGTSGGSSGGTPGVNPSSPPTPTADTTNPSSPTGTPPAGSPDSPNAQTDRSVPVVETAEESAAAVLSGSTIMVSVLALAAGGLMLM